MLDPNVDETMFFKDPFKCVYILLAFIGRPISKTEFKAIIHNGLIVCTTDD